MQKIIDPIDKQLVESELTEDKFVKNTNNGGNEIYIVTWHNAPNVVREIGRLREVSFRDAGGGTGLECDLDEFDTDPEVPFKQLLVWNPREKEIVGGYRFLHCNELKTSHEGHALTPTAELFELSEKFISDYLPSTIELGRSFVQPLYQPTYDLRKGMYALDNIWNGLGAIVVQHPDVKYFFGKITTYPSFNVTARDHIFYFLKTYFGDKHHLVYPKPELEILPRTPLETIAPIYSGMDYEQDHKLLIQTVRSFGEHIPPLVNAYMGLSATMLVFGTALNAGFGNVEETGIMVTIDDIYDFKKARHLGPVAVK